MKRLTEFVFVIISLSFFLGCAASLKETSVAANGKENSLFLTDISKGLPADGLWRQNIALVDLDGDGFSEIVAPPQRKAKPEKKRPFIFRWDIKNGKWIESEYIFPELKDYDYGGVAAGDLNRDGYPDIVLATHSGRVILLENDKEGGFIEAGPLPVKEAFHSRTIALSDINGDGWLDIIALSEASFSKGYVPKGILTGINREGTSWEVRIVEESNKTFSDSVTVSDINGDGNKDLIMAPLTTKKDEKKIIWIGDGKGNFSEYTFDPAEDMLVFAVKAGDVDADGRDELFFKISGIGKDGKILLKGFRWLDGGLRDISLGLDMNEKPVVFDLGDVDGNGRQELVVLYADGIRVHKYSDNGWVELGYYSIPSSATEGASDLKIAKQKDGSSLIVYSLGSENPAFSRGIKAYQIK